MLLVLLNHVGALTNGPGWLHFLTGGMWHVAAFFVLSGFVLYLPAAGRERIEMPRTTREYLRRRARRLLPAYYAAVLLSFSVPYALSSAGLISPVWTSPLYYEAFLWHLGIVHTWNPAVVYMLNAPLWMLGYEWVLSLCLPFFLFVARRGGWLVLLALVIALRIPYPAPVGELLHLPFHPVYTFAFAIGIMAARLARRGPGSAQQEKLEADNDRRRRNGAALALAAGLVFLGGAAYLAATEQHIRLCLWLLSLGVAALMIHMTHAPGSQLARLLSVRPLRVLSTFSYSIFLTHGPLLLCVDWAARNFWGLSGEAAFYRVFVPSLPLVIGLSYAFHRLFERPFLQKRQEKLSAAAAEKPSGKGLEFVFARSGRESPSAPHTTAASGVWEQLAIADDAAGETAPAAAKMTRRTCRATGPGGRNTDSRAGQGRREPETSDRSASRGGR